MTGLDRPKIREREGQSCPRGQLCSVLEQGPEPRALFRRGARCGRWDGGRAALSVRGVPRVHGTLGTFTSVPVVHLGQYWPGYPASPSFP